MHDGKGARGKGPASGKLRLPPLNALRAFHAVARHKSLRQAADELYVTPQAVGQALHTLSKLGDAHAWPAITPAHLHSPDGELARAGDARATAPATSKAGRSMPA